MATIDDFVTINITTVSQTPSQDGFGTPLVAGYHALDVTQRVRTYKKLADALTDGIQPTGVTGGVYAALAAAFAPSPRPSKVKLGRLSSAPTQVLVLTPTTATTGAVYRFDFGAIGTTLQTLTYTVPGSSSIASVCTAIKALIDALALAVTVTTPSSANVTVTATVPAQFFDLANWKSTLTVADTTAVAGNMATDLTAIQAEDNDWYGLGCVTNSSPYVQAIAAWTEGVKKAFFYNSSDTACGDANSTTDVMSVLKSTAYFRSVGLYHGARLLNYSGIGWLSEGLPWPPGSSTFAFKTLRGVPVDNAVSSTQEGVILSKNGNTYTAVKPSQFLTNPGKSAAGQFADLLIGRDWLQTTMQSDVLDAITGVRKLPFTNLGVATVVARVRARLGKGIEAGLLSGDLADTPVVTAPDVANVDPALRASRILPDIDFSARFAGAIQAVIPITGRISV